MTEQSNELDDWDIKSIQIRYKGTHGLNLTPAQAILVGKYEKERDVYSENHFFSAWEEWDYEKSTFKEILNHKQFKNYEANLKKSILQYEQNLIDLDNEKTNEITYNEELLNFYQVKFLPDFFKDLFILSLGGLPAYRSKIDYLRAEYRNFINDTKKEILTSHFRHNRTFKPNELKEKLLRHKLLYILPDYDYFKRHMDEATKEVASYLNTKLRYLPDNIEELLTRKFNELGDFHEAMFKKYQTDTRGWSIVVEGKSTDEEVKEHRTMTLLLLDKETYGC